MSSSDPTTPEEVPPASPPALPLPERLPNASVGRPYRASLPALFAEHAPQIRSFTLEIPERFGLVLEPETGVLHGDPLQHGEFELALAYTLHDALEAEPQPPPHRFKLTVNPNPASLWRNKPSDPNGLFAKPDSASACLLTERLTTFAASLRGRSHAHEGRYRDDDFALHACEQTQWQIFIVADGAGSAKFSRRGSQLACQAALAELKEKLGSENELDEALTRVEGSVHEPETLEKLRCLAANIFTKAAYRAFSAIHKEATEHMATLRDFATTFIVVLARPCAGGWLLAAFSVGDGGAGVFVNADRVDLLTKADSGEHAGTTLFLTKSDLFQSPETLLARTKVVFSEQFRFLAIMTDGVSDPLFPSDAAFESAHYWSNFAERLAPVVDFSAPRPGMELAVLDWLHFPSPGNHDDRTLLLAVPCPIGTETVASSSQEVSS
jgi:serine/threonine protein phosphatase PrpC